MLEWSRREERSRGSKGDDAERKVIEWREEKGM